MLLGYRIGNLIDIDSLGLERKWIEEHGEKMPAIVPHMYCWYLDLLLSLSENTTSNLQADDSGALDLGCRLVPVKGFPHRRSKSPQDLFHLLISTNVMQGFPLACATTNAWRYPPQMAASAKPCSPTCYPIDPSRAFLSSLPQKAASGHVADAENVHDASLDACLRAIGVLGASHAHFLALYSQHLDPGLL